MRWTPTPFITASFVAHGAALAGGVVAPQLWPWWLGLVAGNQALLTGAGLWPRSDWLGPNHTRLPQAAQQAGHIALSFDDGPDPDVTPQVLCLLAEHGVRASFFCVGERVQRFPDLARAIVQGGHRIENHTQTHPNHFAAMGPGQMRAQIQAAQDAIQTTVGRAPRFFRAVAGLRNPMLEPVLAGLRLQLAHWQKRAFDTREADPARVLQRLTQGLQAGDIVLLHDGHSARTATGEPVILRVLPQLLAQIQQNGWRCVTLDEAIAPTPAPIRQTA